jgi:deoxyribonucleoside regulator
LLKKVSQRSNSTDSRSALAFRAAELYYLKKASQREIAEELGCSVPTVSRLLRLAQEKGMVEIRIVNPFARAEEFERALCERFGLEACRVVSVSKSQDGNKKIIGSTAAELVAELVEDGDVVGLSWGVTMREMVNSLPSYRRQVACDVVPLIGGLGEVQPEHQVNVLVHEFAECFDGNFSMLYAPALSDKAEAISLLMQQAPITQVVEMWSRLSMAVVGIGESPPTSPMRKTGYYSEQEVDELVRGGAVGDISGRFFDSNGAEVDASANQRLIAIPFDTLCKAKLRVGVAGGRSKVRAILGTLRGGLVNVLVTDSVTACALLQN